MINYSSYLIANWVAMFHCHHQREEWDKNGSIWTLRLSLHLLSIRLAHVLDSYTCQPIWIGYRRFLWRTLFMILHKNIHKNVIMFPSSLFIIAASYNWLPHYWSYKKLLKFWRGEQRQDMNDSLLVCWWYNASFYSKLSNQASAQTQISSYTASLWPTYCITVTCDL